MSDDQPLRPGTDPAGKLAIGSHQRDHPGGGPAQQARARSPYGPPSYCSLVASTGTSGQRRSLIAGEIAGQRSGCLKYWMRSSAAGFTLVGFGHRPTIATDQTSIT